MSEKNKVISLDERRRRGHASTVQRGAEPDGDATEGGAASESTASKGTASGATASGATATGAQPPAAERKPMPGRLIWLYCPNCGTLEYTELELPGGRRHNACGAMVYEAPQTLDLRAEVTIAQVNLERLDILTALLSGQRERYEEYLRRLELAAGRPLEPYPVGEDGTPAALPVAELDALGLLVSRFFHNPAQHFPTLAGSAAGGAAGGGTSSADSRETADDPPTPSGTARTGKPVRPVPDDPGA